MTKVLPQTVLEHHLLAALLAATWPDGSPLVDIDTGVLRARLIPQLLHTLTDPTSDEEPMLTRPQPTLRVLDPIGGDECNGARHAPPQPQDPPARMVVP